MCSIETKIIQINVVSIYRNSWVGLRNQDTIITTNIALSEYSISIHLNDQRKMKAYSWWRSSWRSSW